MDRKSIIVIFVSLILMFSWYWMVNRLYPPPPLSQRTNSAAGPTSPIAIGTNEAANGRPLALTAGALVASDAPEELIVVENDSGRYTFTSHGGGLKLAELKKFPESVACRTKMMQSTNRVATLNTRSPVPAFAVLGDPALLGDGLFILTKKDNGVRAEKTLP